MAGGTDGCLAMHEMHWAMQWASGRVQDAEVHIGQTILTGRNASGHDALCGRCRWWWSWMCELAAGCTGAGARAAASLLGPYGGADGITSDSCCGEEPGGQSFEAGVCRRQGDLDYSDPYLYFSTCHYVPGMKPVGCTCSQSVPGGRRGIQVPCHPSHAMPMLSCFALVCRCGTLVERDVPC